MLIVCPKTIRTKANMQLYDRGVNQIKMDKLFYWNLVCQYYHLRNVLLCWVLWASCLETLKTKLTFGKQQETSLSSLLWDQIGNNWKSCLVWIKQSIKIHRVVCDLLCKWLTGLCRVEGNVFVRLSGTRSGWRVVDVSQPVADGGCRF